MSEPEKKPPAQTAAAFHTREAHLAGVLGVNRDVIRYLRQKDLREGEHFARLAKKIFYTSEAIELLRQRLNLPPEELQRLLQAAREEKSPPADDSEEPATPRENAEHPAPITLKVWRNFSRKLPDGSLAFNGMLECYKPHTDPNEPANLVRVSVRSGKNYVRHMEIPARHIQGDLYECARPDPRDRGYW